jgi:hypothetical protein
MTAMRSKWAAVTVGAIVALTAAYGATAAYIKVKRQEAFDAVKIGDTADAVIEKFGDPSVREGPDTKFSRYASSACTPPCVERLWFENRLLFDMEAWSVSIGSDGKVVEKRHWVSP